KDGSFARGMPGYAGADAGGFAVFDNPASGRAAQMKLLESYGARGLNTPLSIASRWAPKEDGNDPQAYANFVAQHLGVRPDQPLNMSDMNTVARLADAMGTFEGS